MSSLTDTVAPGVRSEGPRAFARFLGNYYLRRVIQSIALMFGVIIIVFMLVRLTGDPASLMVAREADAEQIAEIRELYGFDKPVVEQLTTYLGDVVTGDLGRSFLYRDSTLELIVNRFPDTLILAATALAFALLIAVPLGVAGGSNPGRPIDKLARFVGVLGQVTPSFWLIMLLIVYFGVKWGLFPTNGVGTWQHLVLPAFALSVGAMGQFVRLTRSAVREVRNEDFVRTARSKGLTRRVVARRHITRNALLSLVSVVGVQFTYMLGGSIYIESIYARPGLGQLLDAAVRARDFPLVQAITIFIAAFTIIMNLLTDVVYGLLDPRIRHGG